MAILAYIISTVISAALLICAWRNTIPIGLPEAIAFVTGALCVWLTVKENIWNWPIGIASSVFFLVLFWTSRLYADMALQIVYIILGFLGWFWWLRGGAGPKPERLQISRIRLNGAVALAFLVIAFTWGMTVYLRHVHDSAPFLDALTTALSLAAQFLLTKKLTENWYVWITADIIYIGLYSYKHLYLSAVLYRIFVVMCLAGLRDWRRSLRRQAAETPAPEMVGTHGQYRVCGWKVLPAAPGT